MKELVKYILTRICCLFQGIPYKEGLYIGMGGAFYQPSKEVETR